MCDSDSQGDNFDNENFMPKIAATVLYIILLIVAFIFYWAGESLYSSNEARANVLLSLATAIGPVSVLGLIYEHILRQEMKSAAIESMDKASKGIWKKAEHKLKEHCVDLEDIIYKLTRLEQVGLLGIFSERSQALKYVLDDINKEENEIYIIGTSLRGLFWPDVGEEKIYEAIKNKMTPGNCKIYFLLTHPAFIHLRQKLESIGRKEEFHIAQEIFNTVMLLKDAKVDPKCIGFVKATPTFFGIMTSNFVLINPYPLQRQAFTSLTLIIDSKNGDSQIYKNLRDSHFKGVWEGANIVILQDYSPKTLKSIFEDNLEKMKLCKSQRDIDYSALTP